MEDKTRPAEYRELRPANVYDVAANETWLEDMAREGYRLTGFSGWKGVFQKDGPAECRYRMSPLPKKEKAPDPELRETYGAMGWQYAATLGGVFHVWRCDDPAAPELDTDPVVQGMGYGYLRRQMVWDGVLSGLLVAALWAAVAIFPMTRDHFLLDIVREKAPGQLLLGALIDLLLLVWIVLEVRTVLRLSRTLRAGVPLARPRSYRRQKWLARALYGGFIVFFLLNLLGSFQSTSGGSVRYGWDAGDTHHVPGEAVVYVDLGDLEGAEETAFWRCRTKVQELCPRYYETVHLALDPQGGAVTASAETRCFRMLTPGLAQGLAEELIQARPGSLGVSPHDPLAPVESALLDGFWWCETTYGQCAAARLGRQVLFLEYEGETDLRTAEGYFAALLADFD